MKIIGINGMSWGLRGNSGERTTDGMLGLLSCVGYEVHDFNYPPVRFWQTRSRKRLDAIAHRLVDVHEPGDAVIAHSFGCLVALRALEFEAGQAARFSHMFLFRPAVRADVVIPINAVDQVHVYKCGTDRALQRTQWLLPYHPMGRLGRVGYKGPADPRVQVTEVQAAFPALGILERNHSHDFAPAYRAYWGSEIDSILRLRRNDHTKTQRLEVE